MSFVTRGEALLKGLHPGTKERGKEEREKWVVEVRMERKEARKFKQVVKWG